MPTPEKRGLSDDERQDLESLAADVAKADQTAADAREIQNRAWRVFLGAGVSKKSIADASGVSPTAITYRIEAPPSRVNRGAGNARGR